MKGLVASVHLIEASLLRHTYANTTWFDHNLKLVVKFIKMPLYHLEGRFWIRF